MGDIANATNAAITLALKDKEYELSPLNFNDLGQLETYIQYREFYNLQRGQAPQELLDKVFDKCSKTPCNFGEDVFAINMQKPDVLLELVYCSIRHKHAISKAELAEQFDVATMQASVDKLLLATGLTEVEGDSKN